MEKPDLTPGARLPIPPDFPVEWKHDQEPTYLWRWDSIHSPLPASPMAISVAEDRERRQTRVKPRPSGSRQRSVRRRINGYSYSANIPPPPTDEENRRRRSETDESIRTIRRRWDTEIRPTMEKELGHVLGLNLTEIDDAGLLKQLDGFLELSVKHWDFHGQVVGPVHASVHQLAELYAGFMGEVPDDEPYKLIGGLDNKSLETDKAIQTLAAGVACYRGVSNVFASSVSAKEILTALEGSEDGRRFREELDGFLRVYGLRPTGFDPLFPSWIEDPSFVIMNIKSFLTAAPRDIHAEQKVLSAEAAAYEQKALERLNDHPERKQKFVEALHHARQLWPLKEDHAFYIDQGSAACVRILLAEIGRRLRRRAVIREPDDVFYLTLDEAIGGLKGENTDGFQDPVSQRRALRDEQMRVIPPPYVGTLPTDGVIPGPPEFQAMFGPGPDADSEAEPSVLRGIGGSAGAATGTAKVVRSPQEFGKIQPGDILVCTSTSPTWTPMFGSVGALVSDSGGVLSHTAIVAREYGLPAVVGVHGATSVITDGQVVTVDGDNGIVMLR